MNPTPRPGVCRLPVRRDLTHPFVAVVDLPEGVHVDERSILTDEDGHVYFLMEEVYFKRLAETAPFSDRRFVPKGREVHVLPPDTAALLLVW